MRNCENRFPFSRFKYQFINKEIITQCPVSYFDGLENVVYQSYNRLRLMKDLGINADSKDITLLEIDAYSIIEEELTSFKTQKIDESIKKADSKPWKKP